MILLHGDVDHLISLNTLLWRKLTMERIRPTKEQRTELKANAAKLNAERIKAA